MMIDQQYGGLQIRERINAPPPLSGFATITGFRVIAFFRTDDGRVGSDTIERLQLYRQQVLLPPPRSETEGGKR